MDFATCSTPNDFTRTRRAKDSHRKRLLLRVAAVFGDQALNAVQGFDLPPVHGDQTSEATDRHLAQGLVEACLDDLTGNFFERVGVPIFQDRPEAAL